MAGVAMIYELAQALQADIEGYVTTSEGTCEVSRVTVTAGRPSAPVGEDCTVIYIWADQVTDLNQNAEDECRSESRLTLNYEINTCYIEAAEDVTDTQHAVAAECLYDLMSLIWCGLVADKDSGVLMEVGDCSFIELGPLEIQPRQGMNVSALGSVVIPYEC